MRLDHDNKYFYCGLLHREYLVNRCDDCGHWHRPFQYAMCLVLLVVARGAPTVERRSGRRIALLTFFHAGPPADGVDYAEPYPLAAVELAEEPGLRIVTTIVNCVKEDIQLGPAGPAPTWIERAGNPVPAFEPAGEEDS